jgi:hypothetical protein
MPAMIVERLPLALAALIALAACGERPATDTGPAVPVDSVFPIEEEIRRFRADLPGAPAGLDAGASPSRDALVARFVQAVEALDTAAVRDMVVSRAEFAYLYYPFTRFAKLPQQLSPALVWFQIQRQRPLTRPAPTGFRSGDGTVFEIRVAPPPPQAAISAAEPQRGAANAFESMAVSSGTPGTRPCNTNRPSIWSAGVRSAPAAAISMMSSILMIAASRPSTPSASRVRSSSALQRAQPGPKTRISISLPRSPACPSTPPLPMPRRRTPDPIPSPSPP